MTAAAADRDSRDDDNAATVKVLAVIVVSINASPVLENGALVLTCAVKAGTAAAAAAAAAAAMASGGGLSTTTFPPAKDNSAYMTGGAVGTKVLKLLVRTAVFMTLYDPTLTAMLGIILATREPVPANSPPKPASWTSLRAASLTLGILASSVSIQLAACCCVCMRAKCSCLDVMYVLITSAGAATRVAARPEDSPATRQHCRGLRHTSATLVFSHV
mmetsp:Transcript_63145/g.102123  ORF Transcript_63145/g.102123 Transcript_63145/m.102123 type:complete len:217 (+) Transcript_63145:231-881(+)